MLREALTSMPKLFFERIDVSLRGQRSGVKNHCTPSTARALPIQSANKRRSTGRTWNARIERSYYREQEVFYVMLSAAKHLARHSARFLAALGMTM